MDPLDLRLLCAERDYDLAFKLSAQRRYPECWSLDLALLERCPEHAEANILAGETLFLRANKLGAEQTAGIDRYERAERYFRRAIELEPDHADAWAGLAALHLRLGKNQQAFDAAIEGLDTLDKGVGYMIFPAAVQYVGEALFRTAASAAGRLGRADDATALLRTGLDRFPHSVLVMSCTGEMSLETGGPIDE